MKDRLTFTMSTPEIVDTSTDDTNLDDFNDLFLGKTKEAPPEDDGPEDDVDEDEDSDATIEQEETQTPEDDDDLAEEDDKPVKLSPTQKRINQLLEKARLAEERAIAAEARLTERKEIETPKVVSTPVVKDDKAPHPDDKNEDGTDKYPLGLFDEAFQDDRFNYKLEKSLEAQKAELAKQAQEQEIRQAQEALTKEWTDKLEPAKERYPDFDEKGQGLLDTFSQIPQEYGEYLTATIMSLDNGPDVLYFLSENIEEAQRIVNLGGTKAAIALGRIDARFEADADAEEKPKPRPKVSKAPAPPPTNRGSSAALAEVPDDTDDLDAFAAKLFKKR